MSDTERREPDANENPYRRKNSYKPAMTQPTDEAAVDIVERLRTPCYTSNDCAARLARDEIETLRAQLTAATRRAELAEGQYKKHIEWSADTIGKLEVRAEQAERMLAEAVTALEGVRRDIVDQPRSIIQCTVWHLATGGCETTVDFIDATVDRIRSAASGEQG